MKRQWKLALCLMMTAVLLSSCAGGNAPNQTVFPEITQNLGLPTVTDVPTPEPTAVPVEEDSDFSNDLGDMPEDFSDFSEADPITEESYQEPVSLSDSLSGNYTVVEETEYKYAGSTPIPLDPVDMPTPTPRAPVNYTYVSYTAGSLGLTFEAPSGWIADDSLTEVYSVIEPEELMVGGQQCVVTIVAVPVNTNYDQRDLEKEVKARLNDIGSTNFAKWEPSLTASRHLMGGKGVYANYSGELVNGVALGGRIHYVCIDSMLYGVEIMYPRDYREDYMNVFDKIRETIKRN